MKKNFMGVIGIACCLFVFLAFGAGAGGIGGVSTGQSSDEILQSLKKHHGVKIKAKNHKPFNVRTKDNLNLYFKTYMDKVGEIRAYWDDAGQLVYVDVKFGQSSLKSEVYEINYLVKFTLSNKPSLSDIKKLLIGKFQTDPIEVDRHSNRDKLVFAKDTKTCESIPSYDFYKDYLFEMGNGTYSLPNECSESIVAQIRLTGGVEVYELEINVRSNDIYAKHYYSTVKDIYEKAEAKRQKSGKARLPKL